MFQKRWKHNALRSDEAIVLLELFEVLERRGRHTEEGSMAIGVDNKNTCNKVASEIKKDHAQNAGVEIAQIKM